VEGDHIFEASGKFQVIDKLLRELHAQKRRVLMFSTSVQTLDVLQDYLSYRNWSYERLDGSVRGACTRSCGGSAPCMA
jgi:SNF2 family DNA or RNA helicase